MTAPEPTPTDEHIDAVARAITVTTRDGNGRRVVSEDVALTVARAQARALLTSTDPRVHEALVANLPAAVMLDALVRAGVLTEQWAVRYEHDTGPTMDNPSGVRTQSSVVASRAIAEQAVKNRAPLSSAVRNRRVGHRFVTEWEVAP